MAERCCCECHAGAAPESVAERRRADGVDLMNPIEAAVACSKCQPRHAVALLNRAPANAPLPPDRTQWFDPPRLQGEGDE